MPTLDTRGVVISNDLTVNYDSSRIPTDQQTKFLDDALKLARTILVSHVLKTLDNATAPHVNMESSLDPTLLTILRTHFRLPAFSANYLISHFKTDMKIVKTIFQLTSHGIGQPITIADSYSAVVDGRRTEPAKGYVRARAGAVADPVTGKIPTAQKGSIHIDFGVLKTTATSTLLTAARTIIHEGTHKFGLTKDHSYRYNTGYKLLTKAQALDNADSYAYTAVSIYKKKPITQMEDNLIPH
jgi:hypothetical protein